MSLYMDRKTRWLAPYYRLVVDGPKMDWPRSPWGMDRRPPSWLRWPDIYFLTAIPTVLPYITAYPQTGPLMRLRFAKAPLKGGCIFRGRSK